MFELFYGCVTYLWTAVFVAYFAQAILITFLTREIWETRHDFVLWTMVPVWIDEKPVPYTVVGKLACWGYRLANIILTTSAIITLFVWLISGLISGGEDYYTPQWNMYGRGLRIFILFLLNFILRFIINAVIRVKKTPAKTTARTPAAL